MRTQLTKLLNLGFIEPSTSPFGAGVLFAPKANGKLRLCIDFRALNAITVPDTYPLPRIDEMIDNVGRSTWFTKLDLHSGFHQIRIHPPHRERTAFKTKYGTFHYKVMPFGLCNSPATFQRTMDFLLGELRDFAGAYVDDIVIYTDDLGQHVIALRAVYEKLRKERLFVNPDKCLFAQKEIEYCGYIVGKESVRPMPEKLAAVHAWPTPQTPTDIKSFLGLCGFYQRFVPRYATITAPLTDLLQKKRLWDWTQAAQMAFDALKLKLLKHPILTVPDPTKPYILHTYASEVGLGATLSQHDAESLLRLVACRSRKLNDAEKKYPVHEKEMLALADTLKAWRHYLLGAEVMVYTDNSALRYLQTNKNPNQRQVRWLELLQQYRLTLTHISGASNTAADALSRNPFGEAPPLDHLDEENVFALFALEVEQTHAPIALYFHGSILNPIKRDPPADWKQDYLDDPFTRALYFYPNSETLREPSNFHNCRIWVGDRIAVPRTRVAEVIARYHDSPTSGHWGVSKTMALLKRSYIFQQMYVNTSVPATSASG